VAYLGVRLQRATPCRFKRTFCEVCVGTAQGHAILHVPTDIRRSTVGVRGLGGVIAFVGFVVVVIFDGLDRLLVQVVLVIGPWRLGVHETREWGEPVEVRKGAAWAEATIRVTSVR